MPMLGLRAGLDTGPKPSRPSGRADGRGVRQGLSGENLRRADGPGRAGQGNRPPESGDVLVVTRLDRLARSTRDLLNVIDAVSKRGAGFRSLKDAWADTTSAHGRLMLTVLGGLAEFERELIRARTGEGRKRAQDRGVRFGRPRKLTPHQRQEAIARLQAGEAQADYRAELRSGRHDDRQAGGRMTAPLAAVWLLLDYPWGLLAFVAIVAHLVLRGDARLR